MDSFLGYRCSICQKEYAPGEVTYTCPVDGGNLDVILDYESIRKNWQVSHITSRTEASLALPAAIAGL